MNKITILGEYIIFEAHVVVLSIGKNNKGQYLLSSYLRNDMNEGVFYYLHSFSDEEIYLDFIKGKISYLNVLKNAHEIFRVKKEYDYEIIDFQKISFEELTEKQKPKPNSFFPRTDLVDLIEDLKKCIRLKQNSRYSALKVAKKLPSIDTNSYPKKSYPKQNQLKPKENYVPKTSTTSAGK